MDKSFELEQLRSQAKEHHVPLEVIQAEWNKHKVYHCIFCGEHWRDNPPLTYLTHSPTIMCPICHDYKGIEPCLEHIIHDSCPCINLYLLRKLSKPTQCSECEHTSLDAQSVPNCTNCGDTE